ncbi:MAG: glycosyltransferase [Thermoproteus sp.]
MTSSDIFIIYFIYSVLLIFDLILIIQFIIYFRKVARGAPRLSPPRLASADPPPISFIVPVKNEPLEVIAAMLTRFSDVDYPRDLFEVLVVSDDEPGYFAKIKTLVDALARELGIDARAVRRTGGGRFRGSAFNWAAEVAKYDVLAFLDVDSKLPRDIARRIAEAVDERTLLFLGWDGYISLFTKLGKLLKFVYKYFLLYGAYLGRALSGDVLLALGSGIALRKDLLRRAGGFCDCVADDYDISLKVLLAGGRIVYDGGAPIMVEIPSTYFAFRKQFARWVFNSSYILRRYLVKVLRSDLPLRSKLSILLNVAQHPLLVTTAVFLPVVGLAAAYTGYIIPPLPVAALEAALAVATAVLLRYVVALARREGYSLTESLAIAAQNGVISLMIDITAFVYMLMGFFRSSITWRVTPKGSSQLAFRENFAPELVYTAAVAAVFVWALMAHMWIFALSALSLLAVLLYGFYLITG